MAFVKSSTVIFSLILLISTSSAKVSYEDGELFEWGFIFSNATRNMLTRRHFPSRESQYDDIPHLDRRFLDLVKQVVDVVVPVVKPVADAALTTGLNILGGLGARDVEERMISDRLIARLVVQEFVKRGLLDTRDLDLYS